MIFLNEAEKQGNQSQKSIRILEQIFASRVTGAHRVYAVMMAGFSEASTIYFLDEIKAIGGIFFNTNYYTLSK